MKYREKTTQLKQLNMRKISELHAPNYTYEIDEAIIVTAID